MSAAVCGSKRSFFEDLPSPSASKRARCSSSSPVRFSPPSLADQLRAVFPHMEAQFLEKALEECGNDIDSAIKRLHELCLGSTNESGSAEELDINAGKGISTNDGDVVATSPEAPSVQNNLPADGAEWVDLLVREMMSSTSVDNARDRAASVLNILEKDISSRVGAELAHGFQKENITLKEQFEVLIRENSILKRAVTIQHERQKDLDGKNQELQQLRQLVSQYQGQIRTLEVNNYALTMHLRQAQQSTSMPGRFNPDVF